MPDTPEILRELLRRHRLERTDASYPLALRQRVGRYVDRQRAAGQRWSELAAALEVSDTALRQWMRQVQTKIPATFLPVRLTDEPPTEPIPAPRQERALTLCSPQGWRIEGLTMGDLPTLLERLA